MYAKEIVIHARNQKVFLYLKDGELKGHHKGAFPDGLRGLIKSKRQAIIEHLEKTAGTVEDVQLFEYVNRTAYIKEHATPEQQQKVEPPAEMSIVELYNSLRRRVSL